MMVSSSIWRSAILLLLLRVLVEPLHQPRFIELENGLIEFALIYKRTLPEEGLALNGTLRARWRFRNRSCRWADGDDLVANVIGRLL